MDTNGIATPYSIGPSDMVRGATNSHTDLSDVSTGAIKAPAAKRARKPRSEAAADAE